MTNKARKRRNAQSKRAPRFVAYVRVSTREQAEDGNSLADQRVRLAAYVTALGGELVATVEDRASSGTKRPDERPGAARALRIVREGKADGLVVTKLDRLTRDVRHTLDLVEECEREGWRLASISDALDTESTSGRLVVTILAAVAQAERERIAERTTEGLEQVAREGRLRSARAPFGYRIVGTKARDLSALPKAERTGRRLAEDAREQGILARLLELRAVGHGAHRIAKALTAEGTPNPRTGRVWSTGTVAAILRTADRREAALA